MGGDQRLLIRDVGVQGRFPAAVFAERQADRATIGATVAETVQCVGESRPKAARILEEGDYLVKVRIQRIA